MVLATALIGVGWILGAREKFVSKMFAITVVDKYLTELAMKQSLLNEIEEGKIDDAKHSLQMDMDVAIITIDAFHEEMDAKSLKMSQKLFSRIAHDRAKYTNGYSGDLPKMDLDADAKIKLILKQASESQTNK